MKHFKITFGIRDGDHEYTETWVMDNPCAGFFGELLPDSDPDNLTDMDNKFLLNHFFGEGLSLGEDDEGNESLEATKDDGGSYWLAGGERLVWIEGIKEIRPIPRWQNHEGEDLVVKNKEGVTVAVVGQLVTDGIYQLLDLLESEGYSIQKEDKPMG